MRIECVNTLQRDFIQLILDESGNRPLFEDDVEEGQKPCFEALEDIEPAEAVRKKAGTTLYATWTIGGADWDDDVRVSLVSFKKSGVTDVYGVVEADEGWYELWILKNGQISRQEDWEGEPLEEFFEGKNNLHSVLDKIRKKTLG